MLQGGTLIAKPLSQEGHEMVVRTFPGVENIMRRLILAFGLVQIVEKTLRLLSQQNTYLRPSADALLQ